MKKKVVILLIIILLLLGVGVWYFFFYNNNNKYENNEIIPEEEISEEQMRQTIVSLYFYDESSKSLASEGRLIDTKELVKNPYRKLMEMLINGPQNTCLSNTIPNGTRVNEAEIKGGILYLDLSNEFIENHQGGEEQESITIYSIVDTMMNLTEVNAIKILINGEENKAFKDDKIKFSEPFVVLNKNSQEI